MKYMTWLTWEYALGYFLFGVTFMIAVFGIFVSALIPGINNVNSKFFMLMFGNLTLLVIACCVDETSYMTPDLVTENKIAVFFEYLLYTLMMPIFTAYLLRTCGENLRNRLFYAVAFFFIIHVILLCVAQVTEIFYYITAENLFYRGEWHWVLTLPMILPMFLNIWGVIRRKNILSQKYFRAFLFYLSLITVVTLIHIAYFLSAALVIGIIFSSMALFGIIFSDQMEQYFRQKNEIINQQANILVLQMRPHFIYNTMTSIYYLCTQNPEQAQKVTLEFTNYLRKNFMAIVSEKTIPFAEELEHAKTYLSIEQVQFEENLFVTYDTPHQNFKVPPLTLQPIVENSVKHGLDPDLAPLHILISTRETENGNEILVEDDGVGFKCDCAKENLALENIKKRLKIFCGGDLIIEPRAGGGTVVKIFIPKEI